jgi:3-oxoacid CoA-transferase subunit B
VPLTRRQIAQRAAQELRDGDYVNLGVGIPTLVADCIPPDVEIMLHSGHGILGIGPLPTPAQQDPDYVSVATQLATLVRGASITATVQAFEIIRGGHIDVSIIGAMQVSEAGDLANWVAPGAAPRGMGGAMDLAAGARRVITVLEHVTRGGEPRIVRRCTLALTGVRCVNRIITDLCVLDVTDAGLRLIELAPGVAVEEVQRVTEPLLLVPEPPRLMAI